MPEQFRITNHTCSIRRIESREIARTIAVAHPQNNSVKPASGIDFTQSAICRNDPILDIRPKFQQSRPAIKGIA
jgi:hypothetical protein